MFAQEALRTLPFHSKQPGLGQSELVSPGLRIHSQDHSFQAFDWQSLFGHFLGQVHQPMRKGGGAVWRLSPTLSGPIW